MCVIGRENIINKCLEIWRIRCILVIRSSLERVGIEDVCIGEGDKAGEVGRD